MQRKKSSVQGIIRVCKKRLDVMPENTNGRKVIPRPHMVFITIICLPIF